MGTVDDRIEAKRLAYGELAEYAKWAPRRDEIICRAAAAGIPKVEIEAITGLSHARVFAILKGARDAAP